MLELKINGSISKDEEENYRKYISEKYPRVKTATITVDGDYVDIDCELPAVHYERVRRITGYLVGTVDRWNDAKRAELQDRVKHQKI